MDVIRTERLNLRPYRESDAPRVLDIHSRLDVIRWLDDPPWTPMAELDEARGWISDWEELAAGGGPHDVGLAIEVQETGVVAGSVMLVPCPHNNYGERQIGWHLHPDSGGHGYATEAAEALMNDAFAAGLDEVWCGMFPDNAPSAAVARRLGFVAHGVVPDPWYLGETRLFSLTREQWQARAAGGISTP